MQSQFINILKMKIDFLTLNFYSLIWIFNHISLILSYTKDGSKIVLISYKERFIVKMRPFLYLSEKSTQEKHKFLTDITIISLCVNQTN